jgi:hypothetical protein
METAMSAARSSDTFHIREKLDKYAPLDYGDQPIWPPIDTTNKSKMGFGHDQLGRLLCPVNLLAEYDADTLKYAIIFPLGYTDNYFISVRERIKASAPGYVADARKFPAFLYPAVPNETAFGKSLYDPKDMKKGLFQGVQVIRVIFAFFFL